MVGMATIRKGFIGVPLLLSADTLTEAVATAIPSADREEKVSWTDAVIYPRLVRRGPTVMPGWRRN
jgi:hypothetical protein